ncbi:HAD superfamily hydrolase (TIGR01509 family)/beta-phosphoglucomutase family hydrolase [Krasilnikovia cinnamomea]|uniref:Beta-phosphoglucomutase n=1 Tax=Krasilnikovia cinnamomea TaxID=349313 RepID=A0A4Q7ZL76_9ACTN|nr:beta-phosphoglucomutase family hydrolase [Krasilnikovia cinnamomea]RZU51710.1 HAD superfamily hydrolase (TIGR01509 family)/beta-phosphoglucomutase family hydrolase [Krasilnikovia cinnamomea]
MLGLPPHVTACLFDLDGVLTQTALVHNAAWKQTFDAFLRDWSADHGQEFVPFDEGTDYHRYVDGRQRADGVRTFLASRGITLPEGTPDDGPDAATVNGLGNRKNLLVLQKIKEGAVQVYPGSVDYLNAARSAGLRRAVVSASANCKDVLEAAGIADLLEARVDGVTAREHQLPGKPAPDTFQYAAKLLDTPPEHCAVFEDAQAGVAAGRAGGFGIVVGVDRVGQAQALLDHGADIVVQDLSELLTR